MPRNPWEPTVEQLRIRAGDRVVHPVYGPGTYLNSTYCGGIWTAGVEYDTRPAWLDACPGNHPGNACGCDLAKLTPEVPRGPQKIAATLADLAEEDGGSPCRDGCDLAPLDDGDASADPRAGFAFAKVQPDKAELVRLRAELKAGAVHEHHLIAEAVRGYTVEQVLIPIGTVYLHASGAWSAWSHAGKMLTDDSEWITRWFDRRYDAAVALAEHADDLLAAMTPAEELADRDRHRCEAHAAGLQEAYDAALEDEARHAADPRRPVTRNFALACHDLAQALKRINAGALHPGGRAVVLGRLEHACSTEALDCDDVTIPALFACLMAGDDPVEALRAMGLLNMEGGDEVCPDPKCERCQ